ncbi:hypothetical protein Tco_0273806 [Tanacetum coccineum]
MYLKKAQSEKLCLYEIPYDTFDPSNRFTPDREETLTLEKESRSKLNKDLVKPYDYTKQNSLYENFKPTLQEYHDQLAHENEIVQLINFIVESGCTKHMTGNLKLLCNFVEKYLGTVRFGNDQFALILGYEDLVQGTASRIKKAQELKTKTSANSNIKDSSSETKLWGRLLEIFQEDAKYEHVGKDTRSQGGKDDQDKQGKDLEISKSKKMSKDNDKGSRSKIT